MAESKRICLPMQKTQEMQLLSLGQEDPLEEEIATPVFLVGKSHEERSLMGYSSWDQKEFWT